MAKTNKKREALREALGEGARLFEPGEATGYGLIEIKGEWYVCLTQIDGEHDGSIAMTQVGGLIPLTEFLDKTLWLIFTKSTRGSAEARDKIKEILLNDHR